MSSMWVGGYFFPLLPILENEQSFLSRSFCFKTFSCSESVLSKRYICLVYDSAPSVSVCTLGPISTSHSWQWHHFVFSSCIRFFLLFSALFWNSSSCLSSLCRCISSFLRLNSSLSSITDPLASEIRTSIFFLFLVIHVEFFSLRKECRPR